MRSKRLFWNSFMLTAVVLAILFPSTVAFAQSSSFTYQGRLTDGGTAADGNYDLQFALWDSLSGGTQIGSTQTLNTVAVSNGVFTVSLDFGASSFPGANRFLEIRARQTGSTGFIILEPRQQVTATPYAVRSDSAGSADTATSAMTATNATNATTATNATQLGGVAATQYVQTGDSRLSDARTPTAGSSNYVQNSTNQQLGTNFNISGNGTLGGNLIANGKIGIGASSPLRPLQIGPSINSLFTFEPMDTSPNAGYIRFGDNTGWKLHIGRSREKSAANGGTLNTGTTGALMTIQDNGAVGIGVTSPTFRLHVVDPANTGLRVTTNSAGGTVASFGANGDFQIDAVNVFGGRFIVKQNGNVGVGNVANNSSKLYVQADPTQNSVAVLGAHTFGTGVWGASQTGVAVVAHSDSGNLMEGYNSGPGTKFHISNNGTYTAGSDFAEAMPARGGKDNYEPGDVLIVSAGASGMVGKARRPNDVRLAGVYSTRPGMLGADKNGTSRVDPDDLPVAIVGIVPTKVSTENGPIQVGDLLTTSSTPGYAMKASPIRVGGARLYRTGTILGKALEPLEEGKGIIKVLVTLR